MIDQPAIVKRNDQQRELLKAARAVAYKELVGADALNLHLFAPEKVENAAGDGLPAIVFFHGGGFWERGEVSQFGPHALHFAERGMVAVLAEYRLSASHGATPRDGMEDARDAADWICAHAGELGIDPAKLVLAGATSGAHAALAAVMDPDAKMHSSPAAMVLFSPIVNTVRAKVVEMFVDKRMAKLASPLHHVRKGLPPMVVFHGTDDRVQGIADVEAFVRKLQRKKNRCELHMYDGERSSFFNFNVNATLYEATLSEADDFLVRAGLLDGESEGAKTARLESWR